MCATQEAKTIRHTTNEIDRYKKQKEKPQGVGVGGLTTLASGSGDGDSNDPDKQLKSGEIPNDFLRQMFYTLGDYRDILFGKDISGDKNIETIKNKIDKILKQSGDTPVKPSDEQRKSWWEKNAEDIWNGMICALTHKTETPGEVDDTVKEALLDANNKPQNPKYKYDKVKLEEENSGPKTGGLTPQNPTAPSENKPTTLTDFISRPTYFRYLEEWGETFCRERAKRLAQIKKDCKVGDNSHGKKESQKCSGYGEHCDDQLKDDPTNVSDLMCQDCGASCRFYKKWIERKKDEYDKLKKIYHKQKTDAKSDNGFCGTLENYEEAKDFLQTLKNGPCKNNSEEGNGKGKQIFDDDSETFKHTKHCDPCSKFKIKCENCKCSGDDTNVRCNDKNVIDSITSENIIYDKSGNGNIEMRVSDNPESGKEFNGLETCKDADIFKGIRKDEWKCGYKCGYNVCEPVKVDGKANDEKHIITIRGLVTHWVQNFLDDYNKIRRKLNPCRNNDEVSKCIKDCLNKCNCAGKWIKLKQDEWGKIKNVLLEQYKYEKDEYYPVTTILEDLRDRPEFKNAIKPCDSLDQFKKSCGLNGTENSPNGKEGTPKDIVECLLNKLQTKANKCKDDHKPSDDTPSTCVEKSPNVEDDDEPLEEENQTPDEAQKMIPKICGDMPTQPEQPEKEEGDCNPAPAPSAGPKPPDAPPPAPAPAAPPSTPASTTPKKPAPKQPKQRRIKTRHLLDHPAVIPALMSSTIMWSIGIAFAAFTYFFLK
ncbi:hypothetical protein PFFCH_05512, partial [Plasmodium falciparum FCH/4]